MAPRRRRWRPTTRPITAQETLTYPTLLEDPNPPAETLAPSPQAQSACSRAVRNRTGRRTEAGAETRAADTRERRAQALQLWRRGPAPQPATRQPTSAARC